jgi:hypothetical protein
MPAGATAPAPAPSSSVPVTFKAAPFGLSLHDKDAAAAAATGCAVTLLAVAPSSPAVGAVKAGYGVASVGGTNARTLSNVEVMGLLKAAVATLGSSPVVVEFMPPQAPESARGGEAAGTEPSNGESDGAEEDEGDNEGEDEDDGEEYAEDGEDGEDGEEEEDDGEDAEDDGENAKPTNPFASPFLSPSAPTQGLPGFGTGAGFAPGVFPTFKF